MNNVDFRICKCPADLQKICKNIRFNKNSNKDVDDIIAALTFEAEMKKRMNKSKAPKLKIKKYKPPHFKDTCVPMVPSMHMRLRYIGHCDPTPAKPTRMSRRAMRDLDFSSDITKKTDRQRSTIRFRDQQPNKITMTTPMPFVKHTDSDKSIFNVPSPKLSGENIMAQRASVKAAELNPPLPAKSGHDLFQPHSGIILNPDGEFVPDVAIVPGPYTAPKPKKKKLSRCAKGGVCMDKKCKRKKCRKYAAMRRRQQAIAARAARSKRGSKGEPCWSLSTGRSAGARDGKPRTRKQKSFIPDDEAVCGLDDYQRPEHPHIPPGMKKGSFKTHSLTVLPCTKEKRPDVHYGILMGSFNMYNEKFGGRSKGRQALTMSVMAYCLAFHYHPKQWTMKLVDNLLDAGDQWYQQCADKVHDHAPFQGMCEVLPFGKKQVLLLNGKKMQVLLCEPDIVGYTMSLDPTVYNLCRGLKAFFLDNRAGILLTRILKVVIWKDKICYYIFDPAGRNAKAFSNYANGTAALINVKDLDSVAEILLSRSVLEDQKFVLAPVKVLKMVDEKCDEDLESEREPTQTEKASMSYRIMSEKCAIVNANMHLGDKCFEEAKFRQALTIAIAAMTYAKISPPNTWYSKTLDKILRFGNKLYVECAHPKVLVDLTVDNIPNQIVIGPYVCEIIIYRERVRGQLFTTKECILNIRTGLEEFFNREYNSGIIDFNNYKLAVWRQKDMYYLFDPYPRTMDGSRSMKTGKSCCLMLLNTDTIANAFTKNWDFLPVTTQFYIHAFKVLKLKKKKPKTQIVCTLSDDKLPGALVKRKILKAATPSAQGDGKSVTSVMPVEVLMDNKQQPFDEEHMGEIISLVDSIQEEYLPPIPLKYKNMPPEPVEPRVVNLDSPTVSVTQVVPPWPKPRDKTNEPPEPDPDPEPTPPPTPPPLPPPEGAEEEEEMGEEELDEEALKKKKEEAKRKKEEEEEARRKAEELPPPMPPPPPSPQGELEVPLAARPGGRPEETEVETIEPVQVERYVLLTEDARKRFKLRQIRKKMTTPLTEALGDTPSEEMLKPHNFKELPDTTQIIRGSTCIPESEAMNMLPFAAIMAIVTSYKYAINTWTPGIVDFVIDTAKKLYNNKKEKFQLAPLHIIPKIGIGHQAYNANIDVVGEGATWQLEEVLTKKFLPKFDRGMITTTNYSCAFFHRNGLYYLFDGSVCNPMGLRDAKEAKATACFMRFRSLHDLVCRVLYNKDGDTEDQQFILSRILVRRLLPEARYKLPEDYDYATAMPTGKKSKMEIVKDTPASKAIATAITKIKETDEDSVGYKNIDGIYRIEGTTSISDKKESSTDVKSCHFVCLIAMLMAAMHPLRTWNQIMVDTCIEKGLEIAEKATNMATCEKRVIKNIILDGKFININIKKIIVVNENPEKTLEQYLKAVLSRLRYVIIRFPQCSMVICQTDGFYHLFDPYAPPPEDPKAQAKLDKAAQMTDDESKSQKSDTDSKAAKGKSKKKINMITPVGPVAGWTLYRSAESLTDRIKRTVKNGVNSPEFYTFELTSVKTAPRYSALNYKLSPLFKPDENPNHPFLKQKKPRPLVDEKMYWLNIDNIPWSRMNALNDLGFPRNTPKTMWKDWHIEFPGDLYSLWGSLPPTAERFGATRGKQHLANCILALVMTKACDFTAWTGTFLDGIVIQGDKYFQKVAAKIGETPNYELQVEDFDGVSEEIYPYNFTVKFEKVIFGFVYNLSPDRFNLSKALSYFFQKHTIGILACFEKNLAFGKIDASYFMFDCTTFGAPVWNPGQGGAYMLKCESLNRLVYVMTITLGVRGHNQLFHLYSATVNLEGKGGKGK
ncbi:uncharacterized protein LOC126370394 [Pectinophora gossypiella]|nr:uncharacterized protein LOC126370394 [Pectinophora gossypiella]